MAPPNTPDQLDLFANIKPQTKRMNAKRKSKPSPQCANCNETYLSDHDVASRFGVSRAAIWRWVGSVPGFPDPIKLTLGTTRWKLSDLVSFEARQKTSNTRHSKSNKG